ncbi:TetR/AcrR family transcriptional regulator [Aeromicrobium alkaliterrae]|uniref:TetR/AcrR family transcriptional regulator n=1 Tax=Aeromicrobium alkaliterrae TaxID=302168 RepID=UPI0031D7EF80
MTQRRSLSAVDERRESRRQSLLDAALELFATRGYLASPIEDLCRAAHVSTKSFYGIYESREQCYLDLMRRTTEHLLETMTAAVVAEGFDDVAAAERRLLTTFARLMGGDPRVATVLFGRGTATTFAVEAERRANRRRTADLIALIWSLSQVTQEQADGIATGVVGGLFDIVADWVAGSDELEVLDPAVLERRLIAFYQAVTAGIRIGKENLS